MQRPVINHSDGLEKSIAVIQASIVGRNFSRGNAVDENHAGISSMGGI
jgi:hypothetical protein